jgi:alpha-glucosidase
MVGKGKMMLMKFVNAFAILGLSACLLWGQDASTVNGSMEETDRGVHITSSAGGMDVEMIAPNILRIDIRPMGKTSPRTPVVDPALQSTAVPGLAIRSDRAKTTLQTQKMVATVARSSPFAISVTDATGKVLVEENAPLADARPHRAIFRYADETNLYGMSGLAMSDAGGGLLRNRGSEIAAGAQGEGGAPFFFGTAFGVLVDSDGGTFEWADDTSIMLSGISRDEIEYFVIAGSPMEVMAGLAKLTGRPPMPPKWTLGFLNSQWESDEAEIRRLAATYRAKHIPCDAFILDYDWKAWGEDNYGEWRWNSSSGPGNVAPNKFPGGASGVLASDLASQGFKLAGILKPRILVTKMGSETEMTEAATYADKHRFWYPGEPGPFKDYWQGWGLDGREERDIDFSNADARAWFWKNLEPSFDAGMIAWWNDEADHTFPWWHGSESDQQATKSFNFNNLQFFNMGRMLYEGQREHSNLRVWSINRNYYLGAQRYGYAEWSGDIMTGFESMRQQRARMLSTLNLGEPHWSMDSGGFQGHPSPENYARWVEFATFVPIDRVHGSFGEKRQPWVYGTTAEAAATRAIRLRYQLLPYIYSYERATTETGVGIVRPLFWMFPDDPEVANESRSWMFGDALLVSPVVERGASTHSVYLPAGIWYDYFRGTKTKGGQTIAYKVDPTSWQDIPVFVRAGSIVATQSEEDYVDQHALREVAVDVFPANKPAKFVYYDDDGTTYAYERGIYYRQPITSFVQGTVTHLQIDAPAGSFQSPLRSYLVKIHGSAANIVRLDGRTLAKTTVAQLEKTEEFKWAAGRDQFGAFTIVRVPAQAASSVILSRQDLGTVSEGKPAKHRD